VLEIPERALVHDADALKTWIESLRALGVKICVEHFGAQLAGINHLRSIRPDFLKLDGRFTRNIHQQPDNQLFIKSLVNIAHGLNTKVIIEMVESEDERAWLLEASVDAIQGFVVDKPQPVLTD
jgi:EAL domain-containing protein (putative c-di-GMP-specific phosphodiesterase class I)